MPRPDLPRRAAAECLGAFALVFAGCGAIVSEAEHPGALGGVGIALTFGLIVMAMVYATGHLSGAHLNPAVTIAFLARRHLPRTDAAAYVAAQLAGALLAAAALAAVWPDQPAELGATVPSVGVGGALAYEALMSAFLMFVIMAVATDTRAVGAAAAIAIGATVGLDALFGGPVTGASMNPARSLGPALVSGETRELWIYLVGPTAGTVLGALAYELVRGGRRVAAGPAGGAVMANALFVCLHNAGRSQMSAALFARAAEGRHQARSAGTTPAERVHPEVVEVMAELGIDLSGRAPRALTRADAEWADVVVTMGCGDECPYIPGKRYLDWDLVDPRGRPTEAVRETRDEIAARVAALVEELDAGDSPVSPP